MEFLKFVRTRKQLIASSIDKNFEPHLVLGNDSCDLDSVVSALSYAYLLQLEDKSPSPSKQFLPVLNLPKSDFPLKTEVVYLLSTVALTADDLVFIEDVDDIISAGEYKLHLVDHNVPEFHLADHIVTIVDHHKLENQMIHSYSFTRVEEVGSCSSLIGDLFYERLESIPDINLAQLIRGTILCDSNCLSRSSGKCFPTDVMVVGKIEREYNMADSEQNQIFTQIMKAKDNYEGLSTVQLFKRDPKKFSTANHTVLMSTIHLHIQEILEREDFMSGLTKASDHYGADVVAAICSGEGEVAYEKHFILYATDRQLQTALIDKVDEDEELAFTEMPRTAAYCLHVPEQISVRKFTNIKQTRKKVLPKVKQLLQNLILDTSNELTHRHRADTDQLTFNLELSTPGTPAVLDSPAPELCSSYDNSGYQTPHLISTADAPPNSYIEPSLLNEHKLLPSFNSSEMVKRIMIKKNRLVDDPDKLSDSGDASVDAEIDNSSCPFTPANSFVDSFAVLQHAADHHLPSFNNREMFNRIIEKKLETASCADSVNQGLSSPDIPFTPCNSLAEHQVPLIHLDQSELAHRLTTINEIATAPKKYNDNCTTPQRLEQAANSLQKVSVDDSSSASCHTAIPDTPPPSTQ